MAEKSPQAFANHTRWDPLFHFFALPVFALTVIWSAAHFIRHPGLHSGGLFIFLTAAAVALVKSRLTVLRVQDRVIRLEERLRLAGLLPEPLRSRISELTEPQLISLRFASDAECAGLVEKALEGKMSGSDIKKSIQNWRPDYWRA